MFEQDEHDITHDAVADLQPIVNTLLMKGLRDSIPKVSLLGEGIPHFDVALERAILMLKTELELKPEGDRIWGPVNNQMVQQEALKDIADGTGQPILVKYTNLKGFKMLLRAMRMPGHGFHGRKVEATVSDTSDYIVYLLPATPSVDPVANDQVD